MATPAQPTPLTPAQPANSGYVDVNGVHMYYEEYGDLERTERSPLVLLHGGVLTIDLSWAELIPDLATRHRVIGVELQGHGRTADTDRSMTPAVLATDVIGLLDQLGIDRAHVMGHSFGAAVTLELAVAHPGRVRSIVPISGSVRPDGMHEDFSDPAKIAVSTRMPTQDDYVAMKTAYAELSPHPEHFDEWLGAMSASAADLQGWPDDRLAAVTAPTLIVMGDHDFVTVEHGALMLSLIPGSQLAVLPGTTHMMASKRADLLLPMLAAFLD